jgi:hypothetical protein
VPQAGAASGELFDYMQKRDRMLDRVPRPDRCAASHIRLMMNGVERSVRPQQT